ncbi:MAG: response regulator [Crocosphaera sp.]|nr:response regulator [Crocosphaera sp.]
MSDKILIIDDELDERKELYEHIYQKSIDEEWYELIFAVSGEEALEIIKKDKKQEIALIILDLRLDGAKLDGIKFANKLAKTQFHKKIIVWTGYPEWESSFSESAQSLIIKVFDRFDYSYSYLKDICDTFMLAQQLEPPGTEGFKTKTKMIGYKAIRQLVKSLPGEQIYKLILEVIRFLPPNLLTKLKTEIFQEIDEIYKASLERNKLIALIEEIQEKTDLLNDIPPARQLHNPWLEIVERRYIDYHLHWKHQGHDYKRYISKKIARQYFPIELREPSKFLNSPDSSNFEEYHVRYYNYSQNDEEISI